MYSTWNSAQYYVAAWLGGGLGGEWKHVYVWLSPFAVKLKLSQYCELAIRHKNFKKQKTKNDENRILGNQSLSERMIEQRKVIQADLVLLNFTLLLFANIVFFKNWWFVAKLHWANLLKSFFFQQHFPHLCLSITVILRIFQTF